MRVMEQNLDKRMTLAFLAASVHVTPAYLCRLFKSEIGVAPIQYINRLRIQRAHDLLQSSFLSVKEIAGAVGYSDPSRFSRDFKKKYQIAPTVFRQTSSN